ncbi:cylicin-2-like [Macrobrachium rosenbergii]|uniref:cylicin-2-like n=1 Tax=Macrobrachium rosenbergii TaxID=79674 RepID=UPI0034D6EAE5
MLDYVNEENYGMSQILPEMTARNWTYLWNTFSRGLDEIDWKVEGDAIVTGITANNDIPGKNGISEPFSKKGETETAVKGVSSFDVGEDQLSLRMKRDVNSKGMKESPQDVITISTEKEKAGLSSLADKNSEKGNLLQVSNGNKIDISLKENSKQFSNKNTKISTDKKAGAKKENKAKSKKKRRLRKKKKGKGKNNKRRKKSKNKKKRRRRRRRRKNGRKGGGKNKRKSNPLVARLIMMSGKLQKFLMTHNINIRKIPVKLRMKDLYPYFVDKGEKRRLRRLLGRARKMWESKVKRTAKKKGKKNMKIFKNQSTWKRGKKRGGKRRRRNKGKRRKSKRRRRKGKRKKKRMAGKAKQRKKKNGDAITKITKKVGSNDDNKNVVIKKLGKLKRKEKPEVPERTDEIYNGITKKLKRGKKNGGKGNLSERERRKRRKKIRKAMRKKMKRKMKKKLKERKRNRKRGKKKKGNKKNRKKNKKNKKRNKKNTKKKKNKNKKKDKLLEKMLDTNEKKNRKKEKAEGINEGKGRKKKDKEMEKLFKELGIS